MNRYRLYALAAGIAAVAAYVPLPTVAVASPGLEHDLYTCQKAEPENEIEPPPPVWKLRGLSEPPARVAEIAAMQRPATRPCPEGDVAVPVPLQGHVPEVPPPSGGNPGYYYAGNHWEVASYGGEVEMGIGQPSTGPAPDHSLGQIAYASGSGILRSVELGWHVDWGLYGNGLPHLFTYVNKDHYESNGKPGGDCYNCEFVPVTGAWIIPGQALEPQGTAMDFGVLNKEGKWWINVNYEWIGYLKGSFWNNEFVHPPFHADYGEVYDTEIKTDMGNGLFGTNSKRSSWGDLVTTLLAKVVRRRRLPIRRTRSSLPVTTT